MECRTVVVRRRETESVVQSLVCTQCAREFLFVQRKKVNERKRDEMTKRTRELPDMEREKEAELSL